MRNWYLVQSCRNVLVKILLGRYYTWPSITHIYLHIYIDHLNSFHHHYHRHQNLFSIYISSSTTKPSAITDHIDATAPTWIPTLSSPLHHPSSRLYRLSHSLDPCPRINLPYSTTRMIPYLSLYTCTRTHTISCSHIGITAIFIVPLTN